MARPSKTDPLRNFKFQVEIIPTGALETHTGTQIKRLGFAVVSGLSVQHELIPYREGGMNTHPHKMVGQSDFGPVTFSKGVFAHEDALYNWNTFLHAWSQGDAPASQGSRTGANDYRCDIVVTVFDHPVSVGPYATAGDTNAAPTPAGGAKMGFKLFNCWPGSFSMTDLNAGDSSIMIQQLVVNHEGFQIEWASSPDGVIDKNKLSTIG